MKEKITILYNKNPILGKPELAETTAIIEKAVNRIIKQKK